MGITLIQAINDFIDNEMKYSSYSKTTLCNLFGVTGKKDLKPYALLAQDLVCNIEAQPISSPDMCEILPVAIRGSIRSNRRNKETAVKVYTSFLKYLQNKHSIVLDVGLPSVEIWSSLERQLYIVKTLHDRKLTSEQFADELLVSSRTIENDFQKLHKKNSDPLLVMGQRLSIDFDRSRGEVHFPSTVHPLFLTMNLTQVLSVLQGQYLQYQNSPYRRYSLITAATIWQQLSDYAKKRLKELCPILDTDPKWYNIIDDFLDTQENREIFFSEKDCSETEGCGAVLLTIKNGKTCSMLYLDEDGSTKIYKEVRIISHGNVALQCEADGTTFYLDEKRVLRSSDDFDDLLHWICLLRKAE